MQNIFSDFLIIQKRINTCFECALNKTKGDHCSKTKPKIQKTKNATKKQQNKQTRQSRIDFEIKK